jgi:hypothetical protein
MSFHVKCKQITTKPLLVGFSHTHTHTHTRVLLFIFVSAEVICTHRILNTR